MAAQYLSALLQKTPRHSLSMQEVEQQMRAVRGRRIGKWLVPLPRAAVDKVWGDIARAVVNGELGPSAKVSAATPPLGPPELVASLDGDRRMEHMVCVYTSDWADQADVARVLQGLRRIGIARAVYYKADLLTMTPGFRAEDKPRTPCALSVGKSFWVGQEKSSVPTRPRVFTQTKALPKSSDIEALLRELAHVSTHGW